MFIQDYLKRGFGSMTKNDVEVYVFNELLKDPKYVSYSDYQFSRFLRIPQSKVKRLRYEADLVYGEKSEEEYKKMFMALLKNAVVKPHNENRIQFAMEDKGLYLYVDNILKKGGRFSDRSFNAEVFEISVDDLAYLLENCMLPEEEKKEIMNKYEQKRERRSTFNEIILEVIKGFASGVGNAAGVAAWTFTASNIIAMF